MRNIRYITCDYDNFLYLCILYQSIGQNYKYTEKYNDVQGIRLANSSEFDSNYGFGESRENIKLREISKQNDNRKSMGEVNICLDQDNEPDKLENSPFHPSKHNTPVHLRSLRSSYFSKELQNDNISPPGFDYINPKNSKSHGEGTKNKNNLTNRTASSRLFSSKLTITDSKNCYLRSCQTDPICNAKFTRLTSELQNAKKQVQYLEDILKMKDLEDDEDGSSTDADFIDFDQGMMKIYVGKQ